MAKGMKEAHGEGRDAYFKKIPRENNPYSVLNAFLRVAWFRGWDQAQRGY